MCPLPSSSICSETSSNAHLLHSSWFSFVVLIDGGLLSEETLRRPHGIKEAAGFWFRWQDPSSLKSTRTIIASVCRAIFAEQYWPGIAGVPTYPVQVCMCLSAALLSVGLSVQMTTSPAAIHGEVHLFTSCTFPESSAARRSKFLCGAHFSRACVISSSAFLRTASVRQISCIEQ